MAEKKTEAELLEEMANYFLDSFDITKVNATHVWTSTERVGRKKFLDENTKVKNLAEANCIEVADWKRSEQDDFFKKVLDMCQGYLFEEIRTKYSDAEIPEVLIDRRNLVPVLNLRDNTVVLFNKKTQTVSEVCYQAWERKLLKDEKVIVTQEMRDALLVYDPYDLETFVPITWEGMEVLKVNTYNAPKWRTLPEIAPKAEMPEVLGRFLDHLFPSDECYYYVLHWMYHALLNRNETYLVLNGKKGAGKGIFCSLLASLVGREHYTEAPHSLLTSQFNAALDKKRLLVFDEFKVGKSEHSRLKRFINKFQNIEKKGVDADRPSEIYNSYVISNNDLSDMFIEWDDRRFSVPDITDKILKDVMSSEEIAALSRMIDDETSELVREFGAWLLQYGRQEGFDEFTVHRSPRYWMIVHNSLNEWQKYVVDTLLGAELPEYYLKDISRSFAKDNTGAYSRFPRNYQKVEDLLGNYRHMGHEILGHLEKIDGEWAIIPVPQYRGEVPDDSAII